MGIRHFLHRIFHRRAIPLGAQAANTPWLIITAVCFAGSAPGKYRSWLENGTHRSVMETLRIGGYQPEASVHTRAMRIAEAAITQRGPSALSVSFVDNVVAHGRRAGDLLEMVEGGELDLCYFSSSYLVRRVPALAVFDLPFQVNDRLALCARLDGELGASLAEAVAAATGYRVLAYWDNGFRHISNRLRPIRHPDDCAGLKLRTMNNALHQRVFRRLGFEPVFIDVAQLRQAVADQVVDAQENPLTNLLNFGLHHHHRYVSLSGHFLGVALVLVNRARFDSWPAAVQSAVREAIAQATAAQRGFAMEEDGRCLAELQAEGVEITAANELDHAAFAAALKDIAAEQTSGIEKKILRQFAG
jgi:C4-dicarboxylate-binding protein DctP